MRYCRKCGAKLPEGAKYCNKCGAPVVTAQDTGNAAEVAALVSKMITAHHNHQDTLYNQYFNQLFDLTQDVVYGNVRLHGVPESDVMDVGQEVYLKLHNNLTSLKDPKKAYGYIKRIAMNTAVDYTRKGYVRQEVLISGRSDEDNTSGNDDLDMAGFDEAEADRIISSGFDVPEGFMDKQETKKIIAGILDELSNKEESAITDFYYNGMSIRDIAQMSGSSEASVKMLLSRARKKIQAEVVKIEKTQGIKLYTIPAAAFFTAVAGALVSGIDTDTAEAAVMSAVTGQAAGVGYGLGSNVVRGENPNGTEGIGRTTSGYGNDTVHGENPNGTEGIGRTSGGNGSDTVHGENPNGRDGIGRNPSGNGSDTVRGENPNGREGIGRNTNGSGGNTANGKNPNSSGSANKTSQAAKRAAKRAAKKASRRAAGGAAGKSTGAVVLSHGAKAAIFAGAFGVAVAGTVGTAAITGHLPSQKQPEPKQETVAKSESSTSAESASASSSSSSAASSSSSEKQKTAPTVWRNAYLNAVNDKISEIRSETDGEFYDDLTQDQNSWFKFVDVNGDDIPELIFSYDQTVVGPVSIAMTCSPNGEVDTVESSYYSDFSMQPNGNKVLDSGGRQGGYYDNVYEIQNSKWVNLFNGEYWIKNDDGEYSGDDYATDAQGHLIHPDQFRFYIGNGNQDGGNGIYNNEVSSDQYYSKLDSVCNLKAFSEIDTYNDGCTYSELINYLQTGTPSASGKGMPQN